MHPGQGKVVSQKMDWNDPDNMPLSIRVIPWQLRREQTKFCPCVVKLIVSGKTPKCHNLALYLDKIHSCLCDCGTAKIKR